MPSLELGGSESIPFTRLTAATGAFAIKLCRDIRIGTELIMSGVRRMACNTAVVTALYEAGTQEAQPLRQRIERYGPKVPPSVSHFGRLAVAAHIIGSMQGGDKVFVQRNTKLSHAATHLKADPDLETLVFEALSRIQPPKESSNIIRGVNFNRPIGKSELVKLEPGDAVFYARRYDRTTLIPFVRGRTMVPTAFVTVILNRVATHSPSLWELHSAWTGHPTPALPGSPHATKQSAHFWSTHALVEGRQPYDPESVQAEPPAWHTSHQR